MLSSPRNCDYLGITKHQNTQDHTIAGRSYQVSRPNSKVGVTKIGIFIIQSWDAELIKKVSSSGAGCAGCVATEMPLPCSPSLESESDSKRRQKAREEEEEDEMCGRGGDKEDKLECKARTGG